jgi:hypothetical protein
VFANLLLVDEVNRASPKTQAALLECMEERQVSVDGITYPLEAPFMVIATQNPIEYEGTYPLPEAQLDRFTMRVSLGYPPLAEEARMLDEQTSEPPLASLLPDREAALAANRAIYDAYQQSGFGPGMARFIGIVSYRGPITAEYVTQPAPDPAMFGLPTQDDGNRTDPLLFQNILSCTGYEPDFDALKVASTRIVLGAGIESEGQMANRGGHAVAERLGTEAVAFPSDHGGFLGGEYGQAGDPDAFAAKLREVLEEG